MIQLKVNGVEQSFDGEPEMPLLWYLRDVLDLTGSKFGCGAGLCGACTVHVNGQATRSCVTTMRDAAGKEVTTIERSEEHTSELQSHSDLVCRLLLEKKKKKKTNKKTKQIT